MFKEPYMKMQLVGCYYHCMNFLDDHSRVLLVAKCSDYINANYIDVSILLQAHESKLKIFLIIKHVY